MSNLHNPSSEIAVLSSFLNRLDMGWLGDIERTVREPERIFYDPKNRAVYVSAKKLMGRDGGIPDISLIIDYVDGNYPNLFEDGSEKYIQTVLLTRPIPTSEQYTKVLNELDKCKQLRDLHRELEQLSKEIQMGDEEREELSKKSKKVSPESPSPSDIAKKLNDIADHVGAVHSTKTFAEIATEVLESEQVAWTQTTFIPKLDEVLGGEGFESGCVTIVAARPKVGKTIIMNSLTKAVLDGGAYPVVLNYETKDIEFVAKMISRHLAQEPGEDEVDVNWGLIKKYLFSTEEERRSTSFFSPLTAKKISEGIDWAKNQDWFVSFDKNMAMVDIEALIREEKMRREEGARIILFVDYLQLQVRNAFKEREEITQLTRFYKKLAGQYKIHVVCLSQMNRDGADNMDVKNLRGSGSIEQDADTVIILGRPKAPDGEEDSVCKNILIVKADTTRLAQGDTFELFIDGATNLVAQIPDEQMAYLKGMSYGGSMEGLESEDILEV